MVDMGNIWDRTTAFIVEHARVVVPIALLAILLPGAVSNVIWDASQQCDSTINPMLATIATVVLTLPTLWAQLALTALAVTPAGETPGRAATAGLARAVLAMVVLFAVFAIAVLPLMYLISATGGTVMHAGCDATVAASGPRAPWYVPAYGIGLGLVAAYVSVRLTMLYPVVIAEKLALPAIGRAFRLSRGMVWKLIGVWLVFMIVYGVASLAVSSAFGAILRLLAPGAGPFAVTSILLAVLVACVRTAFTVIVATFAAQLYVAVTGAHADRARPAA